MSKKSAINFLGYIIAVCITLIAGMILTANMGLINVPQFRSDNARLIAGGLLILGAIVNNLVQTSNNIIEE